MIHKWTWEMLDTEAEAPDTDVCTRLTEMEQEGWTIVSILGGGFSPSGRFVQVYAKRCAYCEGKGFVPCDVGECACPNGCKRP